MARPEGGAAGYRALAGQGRVEHRRRPYRGRPSRAGAAARRLRRKVLVRSDSGGGTHEFLDWLTARSRRLHYSVGMAITEDIRAAIGKVPAAAWTSAYDADGQVRDGTWVADIIGLLELDGLASRDAGHRPQGAPASRCAAAVHRHRRPPVHLSRHRYPTRPARGSGAAAPQAGLVRRPDPWCELAQQPPRDGAVVTGPAAVFPHGIEQFQEVPGGHVGEHAALGCDDDRGPGRWWRAAPRR